MAEPHVQVSIQSCALVAMAVAVIGCDSRGGSRVMRLTALDRFRVESIKAVAAAISEKDARIGGEITIVPPTEIAQNEHVVKQTRVHYRFHRTDAGVLLYEDKSIASLVGSDDNFRKVLLSRRPDGEIRFLKPVEWESEISVTAAEMISASVAYRAN